MSAPPILAALAPLVVAVLRDPGVALALRELMGEAAGGAAIVPLNECGLDAKSVRRAVRQGRLPSAKIGRRTFVKQADVARLFDELASEQRDARDTQREERPTGYASVVALERRRRSA